MDSERHTEPSRFQDALLTALFLAIMAFVAMILTLSLIDKGASTFEAVVSGAAGGVSAVWLTCFMSYQACMKLRGLRLSVRTLLIGMTLAALGLGWIVYATGR
jgi:hypothetical protein